jgi:hypothetical protein
VKIYSQPVATEALDQGDLIDNCPIVEVAAFDLDRPNQPLVECAAHRAVVLTQTCDLANQKTQRATVALVYEAQQLVEQGLVKASDVREHLAKHFADTFSRIGLPLPYETE